jgi:hypothetical protein
MWRGHSWKKRFDHGIDRLPFFLLIKMLISPIQTGLVAGLFFAFTNPSFATTFGPISVVEQAANSQYYVHGKVAGSSWVEKEPTVNRPYTYWRITVSEQLYGDPLPADLIVRQPGGEIGDMGYHVAGSAEFAGGEDVFVALHDTDQNSAVKEVVGLASGKYRVERGPGGEKIVMSGLGLPVTGGDGKKFSPEEFAELLRRIARKQTTPADRNVFVSRNPTHEVEQSEESKNREEEARIQRVAGLGVTGNTNSSEPPKTAAPSVGKNEANRVEERLPDSEEKSTGSTATFWIIASVLLLALLGALVLALKR